MIFEIYNNKINVFFYIYLIINKINNYFQIMKICALFGFTNAGSDSFIKTING